MIYDDMFLTVSEPPRGDGKQRQKRKYEVKTMTGKVLAIDDLAIRMGRKPGSVYQLLRNLPLGTHGANFQDMIRKSSARAYRPSTTKHRIIIDGELWPSIERILARTPHEDTCPLEIWRRKVVRYGLELEEFAREHRTWREHQTWIKAERAAGRDGDSRQYAEPARPKGPGEGMPACDCGREADERAVREALDRCEVAS